jgi:hypothetical protein
LSNFTADGFELGICGMLFLLHYVRTAMG